MSAAPDLVRRARVVRHDDATRDDTAESAYLDHAFYAWREMDRWLETAPPVEALDFTDPDYRAIFNAWAGLRAAGKRATAADVERELLASGAAHASTLARQVHATAADRMHLYQDPATFADMAGRIVAARRRRDAVRALDDARTALLRGEAGEGWEAKLLARLGPAAAAVEALRVVSTDDIFAPLETPDEIVAGLIRRKALVLLAAYGASSKTWQGIDLCVAVALGLPWLGRFPAKRGRATFVDAESGDYEMRRRIQATARARGLGRVEGVDYVSMPGGYLGEAPFMAKVERLATERDLIVIDSLRALSLCDENDSRIRLGLDQLRAIGERTGCAFVVLVHGKKTSGNPGQVDERETLRGSSAVFDAADVVLVSTFKKDDERFDVAQVKARHGRRIEPFAVRLVDRDGGVAVLAEDVPDERAIGARTDEIVTKVHAALRESPGLGMEKLAAAVGGNASTVRAVVAQMVETGSVVDLTTKRGQRIDHSFRLRGDA